ncbi:hypothetical protein MBLNU230_g7048t1 [Neophaeotheca triangularis]
MKAIALCRNASRRLRPDRLCEPCLVWKKQQCTHQAPQITHISHQKVSAGTPIYHARHFNTVSNNATPAEPTIYALSSAPGRAAIAVIRVSGPDSLTVYHTLCPTQPPPKPRYATVRTLYTPNRPQTPENILDTSALLLYFPAPHTATGEAILELHVHGGLATVRAVLAAIPLSCPSIRYAEPGEFTRRAFLNDRLDLTQVEALGDTLAATTEQQRLLSVRGTTNSLAQTYETWRQQLLYARGELEALIDFSEDQHFDESPGELCASVAEQVRVLKRVLEVHVGNAVRGELLRNGIALSFLGAPNVGKSSLLNRIVGREAAIVSQEAGTTRDVVEVGLDLGGYFCRLGDTAGLRKAKEAAEDGVVAAEIIGQIEKEGMRRARERAAESDVVVVVLSFEDVGDTIALNLDPEVLATARGLIAEKNNVLIAINKTDRLAHNPAAISHAIDETLETLTALSRNRIHLISCQPASPNPDPNPTNPVPSDPSGIQPFLHALTTHFAALTTPETPSPSSAPDPSLYHASLGASERHRLLLSQTIAALEDFLAEVATTHPQDGDEGVEEADIVLAAEFLRAAAECLAKITGKGVGSGDVEEVLGVVFEKFCVGK